MGLGDQVGFEANDLFMVSMIYVCVCVFETTLAFRGYSQLKISSSWCLGVTGGPCSAEVTPWAPAGRACTLAHWAPLSLVLKLFLPTPPHTLFFGYKLLSFGRTISHAWLSLLDPVTTCLPANNDPLDVN